MLELDYCILNRKSTLMERRKNKNNEQKLRTEGLFIFGVDRLT